MITIACVYRSGGDFTRTDVAKLFAAIQRGVGIDHRSCCLTDRPDEVLPIVDIALPLTYTWPGWWAKMELFRISGPVLYFDLDTWILRPIEQLCEWALTPTDAVLMLRDFYHGNAASGIMAWNCDLSWLTLKFAKFAQSARWSELVHGVGCNYHRGDQEYIREQLERSQVPVVFAQEVQSGIYSYKVDVKPSGKIPEDAAVVCFHGRPRPSEVEIPRLYSTGARQ